MKIQFSDIFVKKFIKKTSENVFEKPITYDHDNDEDHVKVTIDHPLMKTVYAIHYDANQHRLYSVSGKNGKTQALGFTFNVHSESFGELIAMWEPDDKFGEPHDLALSVNGRSLFVGDIHRNRIDSFGVLN